MSYSLALAALAATRRECQPILWGLAYSQREKTVGKPPRDLTGLPRARFGTDDMLSEEMETCRSWRCGRHLLIPRALGALCPVLW